MWNNDLHFGPFPSFFFFLSFSHTSNTTHYSKDFYDVLTYTFTNPISQEKPNSQQTTKCQINSISTTIYNNSISKYSSFIQPISYLTTTRKTTKSTTKRSTTISLMSEETNFTTTNATVGFAPNLQDPSTMSSSSPILSNKMDIEKISALQPTINIGMIGHVRFLV